VRFFDPKTVFHSPPRHQKNVQAANRLFFLSPKCTPPLLQHPLPPFFCLPRNTFLPRLSFVPFFFFFLETPFPGLHVLLLNFDEGLFLLLVRQVKWTRFFSHPLVSFCSRLFFRRGALFPPLACSPAFRFPEPLKLGPALFLATRSFLFFFCTFPRSSLGRARL